MSTLMSAVRKNDKAKFKQLLVDANSKHVDNSILISVRDDHPDFIVDLLTHPNLTEKGITSAFSSAIMNRKWDLVKTMLDGGYVSTDIIIEQLKL